VKTLLLLALLAPPDSLPEGPGKQTVIKVCSACHAPEAVVGNRNSRRGWTELVDEMIFKGAQATPREKREIVDYLAKKFPMTAQ
jgi:competence protein ComEA